MKSDDILLTGATGFLGAHFLRAFVSNPLRCAFVVTRGDPERARARVRTALERACAAPCGSDTTALLDRVVVLPGDILLERCGLDDGTVSDVRGRISEVWHLAASLKYEKRHSAEIHAANVDGTRHALRAALAVGAKRFVYISTAYVAGTQEGMIAEELAPPNRTFNNEYESSKATAEHLVVEFGRRHSLDTRIVRPSIIVGPRTTYASGGSESGLYGFVREVHRMRSPLAQLKVPLAVEGDPSAPLNFVPVDDVVAQMLELRASEFPAGPIYHITSDRCPTVADTLSSTGELCGTCAIDVVTERGRRPTPVERVFDRRARFYRSYLVGHRNFVRSYGAPISVATEEMRRFIAAYVGECGEDRDAGFFRSRAVTTGGRTLATYEAGKRDGSPLILVNAYGMPVDLWAPLARRLGERHRIITWQMREWNERTEEPCGPEEHLSDIAALIRHHRLKRPHLIGWCTGADIALAFAQRRPESVGALALLGGPFYSIDAAKTPFQLRLERVVSAAGGSRERAALYHGLIYGHGRATHPHRYDEHEEELGSILSAIDPELLGMTSLPFRTAQSLFAYAGMMNAYFAWSSRLAPPAVACDGLIVHGEQDAIVHAAAGRRVADLLGARYLIVPEGTHFAHYHDHTVADAITEFLTASERTRRRSRGPRAMHCPPRSASVTAQGETEGDHPCEVTRATHERHTMTRGAATYPQA